MPITRRVFLKAGAATAAVAAVAAAPHPLLAYLGAPRPEPVPPVDDPRLRELAARALDAARRSGAAYADARLTHTWTRRISPGLINDAEEVAVGVRALVDGYWGFASSPVWSPDEMARLGAEAVHQARANAIGRPRHVALAPAPAIPDGHWVMPVEIDAFEVPPTEICDFLDGLALHAARVAHVRVEQNWTRLVKQEKAFASTAGSYCTQRTYRTEGKFAVSMANKGGQLSGELDFLSPAAVGWELYRGRPVRDAVRALAAELEADLALPPRPVDVGRYDTVLDARSVTTLLHETLAPATELDRALGYEANAGGTSWINDPLAMLGSYHVGAPSFTLGANRSEPGGCATVKWDDDGIAPDDFTLVDRGTLVDFQTTRESAGWLADYYARRGATLRSHGCASAPSAIFAPLQHAPNLVVQPGRDALDFDALIGALSAGIAVKGAGVDMDFQHLDGLGRGLVFEVRKGKRVARLQGAGFLFRAPELWKGLAALGGASSARRFGYAARKGEPGQVCYASVTAPPAAFTQLTLIDVTRKA